MKYDYGKLRPSLVPASLIGAVAEVRKHGIIKYGTGENWRNVEIARYHEAILRHTLEIWHDIKSRDKESGLYNIAHIATNIAFILELLEKEGDNNGIHESAAD